MTAAEFHETMLGLLRREPFQPFDIVMNDGRAYRVHDPEQIATNGGAALLGQNEDEIIFIDWFDTARLGDEAKAVA